MQFTVPLKEIKRAITRTRPGVGRASGPEMYRNARLVAETGRVTLTTTDGELVAVVVCDADVDETGEVVVAFDDLAPVGKLKGAKNSVRFEVHDREVSYALVEDGEQTERGTFPTVAPSEWPEVREPVAPTDAIDLDAIDFVLSAAAGGEGEMGPAAVRVRGREVTATNGIFLAHVDLPATSEVVAGDILIPTVAVKALVRAKGPARIAVDGDGWLHLHAREATYLVRGLSAPFPAWDHLRTTRDATEVTFDLDELRGVVDDWAKLVRSERLTATMLLRPGGDGTISCFLPLDELHQRTVPGSCPGDVAVDPARFKDLLDGLEHGVLHLSAINDNTTSGVILSVEQTDDGRSRTRLLSQMFADADALIGAAGG